MNYEERHTLNDSESENAPVCSMCGERATCLGSYEGEEKSYGCDTCCGHGNEDGECCPLPDAH